MMAAKKKTQEEMAPGVSSHSTPTATAGATASELATSDEKADAKAMDEQNTQVTSSADLSRATRQLKTAQRKRVEREKQVAELADALSGDGVDSVTASSEPKAEDINPGFTIMDLAGIKDWFAYDVQWLRDRGATVNPPVVVAIEVEDRAGASATREVSSPGAPEMEAKNTLTVFEGTLQWQYPDLAEGGRRPPAPKDDDDIQEIGRKQEALSEWQARQAPPVTVKVVHFTELDAWRDLAQQALARRHEV